MKLVIHTPFGALSQESGVMYLLGNYCRQFASEVYQLRCNGTFSLCDRDGEANWRRRIHSCANCMCNQRALAEWSQISLLELSSYMEPDDIRESRRWVLSLSPEEMKKAVFGGVNVLDLCRGTFKNRFGASEPDLKNRNHELFLQKVVLSSVRMQLASRRFFQRERPDYVFVASGEDFITRSFLQGVDKDRTHTVVFKSDLGARSTKVFYDERKESFSCDFVLDGLARMRADYKTWPSEIVSLVEEVLSFIGLENTQAVLPLSHQQVVGG